MLQKVKVVDPGDTEFLKGEHVDRFTFVEVTERAVKKGGQAVHERAVAPGYHQGEPDDAVVHLDGVVPGGHAGP